MGRNVTDRSCQRRRRAWPAGALAGLAAVGAAPPSAASVALETEDSDLRSPDFNRESGGNVAGCHRDFLRAVGCISDHSATNRAADLLAPQLLAGRRVKRIEIAAHVAKEHKAPRGRRHGAHDRIIGLQPPLPHPRVGVDGVKPSAPISVRAGKSAEYVGRIESPLSRPELPGRRRDDFLCGLQLHCGAPVDVAGEDEIGQRVVARAVPFPPLATPGQKWMSFSVEKGSSTFSILVTGVRYKSLLSARSKP